MYELKVTNNRGDELTLTNNPDYVLYKITGLNPPAITINSSVNATTDGSSVNSVRVESRNIVIYLTMEGDVEASRINLYKYFPLKKTVKLFFRNGKRMVTIEGLVEIIECDLFTQKQVAQISLICSNPYFKDVDELVTSFSDVNSLFEFPFSIPASGVAISSITNNLRKSIVNAGDIDTGIIIELYAHGSVVNPTIYNVTTGERFTLNVAMLANDTIIINTNAGNKSVTLVRGGVTTNAMGYMRQDNDWFTLISGDNVFTFEAESGESNLQLTFTSSVLYSGV